MSEFNFTKKTRILFFILSAFSGYFSFSFYLPLLAQELTQAGEPKVSANFNNIFVEDAAKSVARSSKINLIMESPVNRTVTLKFTDTPASEALLQITRKAEVNLQFVEGIFIITKNERRIALENIVKNDEPLTLNIKGEKISNVYKAISKLIKTEINYQADRSKFVTAFLSNVPAGKAMELIALCAGLKIERTDAGYRVFSDSER